MAVSFRLVNCYNLQLLCFLSGEKIKDVKVPVPGRTYHDGQLPLPRGGFNCILLHPWPDAGGLEPLCWGNHEDFTNFITLSLVLSGTTSINKRWFQNCFLLLVRLADV